MPAAQNTIQISLTNLTTIPLTFEAISPDPSTWSTVNGNVAPTVGNDFGVTSSNGPSLNVAYTNTQAGAGFTASLTLEGDYNNQWLLSFTWGSGGVPVATVTKLGGTNVLIQGVTLVNNSAQLANLSPDTGNTAVYQVLFNKC